MVNKWELKDKWALVLVGIVLIALVLRLVGIGSFMTVDEEQWMVRSGDFYHKLVDKADPGGTFTTTHPGATTQWLAGAGIYWKEAQLGIGVDTSNLSEFRKVSTVPIAVAVAILIGVTTWLIGRLMGRQVALWAGVLLAAEPYLVGMSQIVHVDMLLALLMLASVLAVLLFRADGKWRWLVVGGVFAGLAFGTKLLPALWLVVFIGVMLIINVFAKQQSVFKDALKNQVESVIRQLLFVLGVSVMVFWAVWPAMWVKSDLEEYYQRDIVSITTQDHVALAASKDPIEPTSFYIRTVLGRTTPLVLFMSIGVMIAAIKSSVGSRLLRHLVGNRARHDNKRNKGFYVTTSDMGWLALYVVGFLIFITLAAKKADRYALPALVVLPVMAGAGWAIVMRLADNKWAKMKEWGGVIVVLVILLIISQPLGWMPYAIAYDSDLFGNVRPRSQQGWGEGLDEAARLLNDNPLADRLTVATWYPGVVRSYFNGKTMSLSSRDDERVGYVVTYRNMGGRAGDDVATDILAEFEGVEPEYVVSIGEKEYVWIYETLGLPYFPLHIDELVGSMEVGQTVKVDQDSWDSIEIGMATFSSRNNNKDVVMQIKDSVEGVMLRDVVVNAGEIEDSTWHRFDFEVIENAKGREFYVSLTSPDSVAGDAVTVRFVDRDVLSGEMVLLRRELRNGESLTDFIRPDNDIAYRLP